MASMDAIDSNDYLKGVIKSKCFTGFYSGYCLTAGLNGHFYGRDYTGLKDVDL